MSGGQYSAVPNPGNAHLEADLGADRPASYMSEGSIMGRSDPYLGSNDGPGPEPSIISRDSTHSSLRGPPSVMGSHTARSSWGSIAPLGVADGGAAGADVSQTESHPTHFVPVPPSLFG
jgi:hypothetical protein